MTGYKPPFEITNEIASLLIEVSGLLERWSASTAEGGLSPQLLRSNRIKTIQASLAIEQNTLTVEQVTAIMDGKNVLGLPREILEVQNAIKVYEALSEWSTVGRIRYAIRHLL